MEKPKILIVDDRLENLISLEAILSGFEVTFVRAMSGMDALRETLKDDFALAILDVQMPEMDGYETLSLMRKREKTKYLPVIFVSAIHQSDLHIIKGIETGAVDFIPKPIIPEILIGKVAVFLDLYKQKQQMKELLLQLEKSNLELEIQKNKAEEATRLKSIFLANMTHEIRTPLNGIIGISQILEESGLNEEQAEMARIITTSGEILSNIVNDILDFSKIEAGQIQIECIPFNLEETVQTVVKLLKFKADKKGLELKYRLAGEIPSILIGDPYRITQILTNLINNAVKFTDKGSVTVDVNVLGRGENEIELIFSVTDTGIGISEEGQKKLFKEFSQTDSSTTRKYGGTGLGLSICRGLVTMMNGEIGVNSEENKGSQFWFRLKFKTMQSGGKGKQQAPATIPGNLRILIAEDNLVNQRVAKFMLQKVDATCDMAMNGKEALEMLKSNTYDLVLMDMFMPEMNGVETTRFIREFEKNNPQRKPVYIVAVSANTAKKDRDACLKAGMNDFISKPFKESELMKVIKDAINH